MNSPSIRSQKWDGYLAAIEVDVRRSAVWEKFDLFKLVKDDGSVICDSQDRPIKVVRCKSTVCGNKELAYKSSTYSMLRHLRTMHGTDEGLGNLLKRPVEASTEDSDASSVIDYAVPCDSNSGTVSFSYDRLLANFLISMGLPWSTVENSEFKDFLHALNPNYQLPDRQTVSNVILRNYMDLYEAGRRAFFAKVDTLAVSIDEYSSPGLCRSFLAFKAHGVNQDFNRFQFTIDLIPFSREMHSATNVASKLHDLLTKCGISLSQLTALVTEEVAEMQTVAGLFSVPWLPRMAHRVDLAVRELLVSVDDVKRVVQKIRKNATIFHHNVSLHVQLQNIFQELGTNACRLTIDAPTQWNSTLRMLRSAKRTVPAVNELVKRTVKASTLSKSLSMLTDEDCEIIDSLIKVLEVFEEVAKEASKSRSYISDYIPCVVSLTNVLHSIAASTGFSIFTKELAMVAKKIVKSRFLEDIEGGKSRNVLENRHLQRALFLDPRYCGKEKILDLKKWMQIKNDVESELKQQLCDPSLRSSHYSSALPDSISCLRRNENLVFTVTAELRNLASGGRAFDYILTSEEFNRTQVEAEIGKYCAAISTQTNQIEPKVFWRKHRKEFPNLYSLALKSFNAPLKSIGIEQMFSELTYLLSNESRNRLSDQKICKIFLLRDYVRKRGLYSNYEYPSDLSDDDSSQFFDVQDGGEYFQL